MERHICNDKCTEKFAMFKSIGESEYFGGVEMIEMAPGLTLNFDCDNCQMHIEREIDFNGMKIHTLVGEDGIKKMVRYVRFCFEEHENGLHCISKDKTSPPVSTEYYTRKNIFSLIRNCEERGSHIVKFNESLKLDFDDVPDCLEKYFKSLKRINQPYGVMFLDLEIETI